MNWSSAHGVATILLLSIAVVYVLIGSLGIIIKNYAEPPNEYAQRVPYLGTPVHDHQFGESIKTSMDQNPLIDRIILIVMNVFMGFMVGFGVLMFGLVWFGVKDGQSWALWTVVIANVIMLASYWLLIILPVMKDFNVSYWEVFHPYAIYPTVVLPIAICLEIIANRG